MITLKVKENEYKINFGYNSLCDTDLLDRTEQLFGLFTEKEVKTDDDVKQMGQIKELFQCVRDLLFVGFEKFNPVDDVKEIGNILDDYHEEGVELGEDRGIINLFVVLTNDLLSEGFLAGLLTKMTETVKEETASITQIPQDHKKKQK